jgi:peptidoglycan/LPS O-acetylase OafA/YrhL
VFSGGYVGVDIFFVISGFLITTIIVREIGENKFSITTFYERRFRRILPAVITMVSVSLLAAYFLLDIKEYENLARSSITNNLFVSNIYFHTITWYFDRPAELKPLLHTWSLSVEEQYYVFFPLLLLVIAKLGRKKYLHFLIPILFLSLGASVLGMSMDKSAVFYLLPTRAWELLIGSLLAIVTLPRIQNITVLNVISALGFSMMVYSIIAFTRETPFPSGYAAIPVFGAALVIYTGSSGTTLVNQFLAIRPIVFVGLISYSLYLWHWPLIVYTKSFKVVDLTTAEQFLLLAVIFILSVLSWRFVETPFRKKRFLPDKRSIFTGSFVATAVLLLAGLSVLYTNGYPGRYSFNQSADELAGDPEWIHWHACEDIEMQLAEHNDLCRIGRKDGKAGFISWGDSHARALASAVNASAVRNGASGVVASHTACPPFQGVERPGQLDCRKFNQTILEYLSQHPEISTVMLAARWALSAKGSRYKHEMGGPVKLIDISSQSEEPSSNPELFDVGLQRIILSLQRMGKSVVLVKPVPEIGYDVPSASHSARITGRDANLMVAPSMTEYISRNEEVLVVFSRLERDLSVATVDPAAFLCDDICVVLDDGIALYRDDNHLSTFGSKYVSVAFDHLFSEVH